ncbi:MAG TPA: calcium-binding protein, partial [Fluviicoccus sp.]|nr:calcium-binding protein [Fluviicoccus sp.]
NAANIATLTLGGTAGVTSALGNTLDNIFNARNTFTDTGLNGKGGSDKYYLDATDTVSASVAEGAGDTVYVAANYDMSTNAANVSNLTIEGASTVNKGNAQANIIDSRNGATNADIQGLGGDDIYIIDATGDTVTEALSAGNDTVKIIGSYTLGANIESLILEGSGNYSGTGNASANTLTGNSGDNTLFGGGGTDTFNGGTGNDVFYVDSADDVVSELSGEGNDTVFTSVSYTLTDVDVENITLSGGAAGLVATGNTSNNVLDGSVSAFADTLKGGLGDDIYYAGSGDVVDEAGGGGVDTLIINYDTSYTLAAGAAIENIILGEIAINRSASGNELANFLQGNATDNTLVGGDGDDTLDGMGGNDSLVGGLGNDAFFVDNGSDSVSENLNEGQDTVYSQAANYTLPANIENLYLVGLGAINGAGNSDNNQIVGNAGANNISGGGGNDVYNGMQGSDTIVGGTGNSTYLYARGDGADTVTDTGGTDAINFGADISLTQLWFNASGNDLVIWLVGTAADVSPNADAIATATEKLIIKDWYLSPTNNQIELFTTADGYSLTNTNVALLVTAMSTMTPPSFGYTDVPPEYYDALESVYYAAWQSS